MFTFEKDITNHFFNLIQGKIALQEFSTWVYNSEKLLNLLRDQRYCELIAIDYNGIFAAKDIENLIYDFYKESELGIENEIIFWILESMVDGTYDFGFAPKRRLDKQIGKPIK